MNTNVNLLAPIGVMALLGTGFLFFLAALVLVQSLVVRKTRRAKFVLLAMLLIGGVYLAAILLFSLASHEKVLARGEEKHFCEIDCHLAYSIVDTRQSRTIGTAANQTTARGIYAVVTIKTRFDETTISPRRGDGLLYPNSRALMLIDEQGNRYGPSSQSATPLTNPLRPGESYTTDLAFDLPAEVKHATLLINEGDWITHLVIGHENSPLHKKTTFQIDLPPAPLVRFDHNSQACETTSLRARCELHQREVYSRLIQLPGADGSRPQTNRVEPHAEEGIATAADTRSLDSQVRRRC
jgi:hypothetical protein